MFAAENVELSARISAISRKAKITTCIAVDVMASDVACTEEYQVAFQFDISLVLDIRGGGGGGAVCVVCVRVCVCDGCVWVVCGGSVCVCVCVGSVCVG